MELLLSKAEMLNEYFAISLSPDARLLSLPLLLDHYTPDLSGLPRFVLALANEVR